MNYDTFATYYDADIHNYSEDILLYREMARRTDGPVLELMSGSGRVILPLAQEGYHVTGVDLSQVLLDMAHERAIEAGIADNVSLLCDDVRTVELPTEAYGLVFIAINSFMHLTRTKDQLATLTNMYKALSRDGLMIIDLFNPDPCHLSNEDNRLILEREYDLDDRHIFKFVASESDMATQISTMTFFYDSLDEQSGQTSRQMVRFPMRWLYRYEMEHLLARAGFTLRSVYGSYDLDDYQSNSERIIFVASKSRTR